MKNSESSLSLKQSLRIIGRSVMNAKYQTGILLLALTWIPGLQASTLVSYGSNTDYVTANTTFARTATRTSDNGTYTYLNSFSDTTALSPSSGYTGPSFYGGYSFTVTGASAVPSSLSQQSIYNSARSTSYDDIYIQAYYGTGWSGATMSMASVFIFKLSSASTLTSMTASLSNNTANTFRTSASWRWVVQSGGSYYVSQTTFNAGSAYTPYAFTLSDLSSTQWALYTPSSSLNFDQSSATYSNIDLTNITAAGLYLENDSWTGDSGTIGFEAAIQSFSVEGTAVPETKSTALLLFGVLFIAGTTVRSRICAQV